MTADAVDPFAFTDDEIAWAAEHDPDAYAEIVALMEAELQDRRATDEASQARRQMSARWGAQARPEQIPPDTDWWVWLILAGRGWGKTRTGAEWAAAMGRRYPGARIAMVAPTAADGRDTMVEGESGLLSVLADAELRGGSRESGWNRSLGELFLANGSRYKVFSAEKPGRLRGPQHHFAWADEPAVWQDATLGAKAAPERDTTWSNLVLGLRLGAAEDWPAGYQPRVVATTTPKPVRLLKAPDSAVRKDPTEAGLMQQDGVVITAGRTDENLANLADVYVQRVVEPLRGTRLGQQELDAVLLEDVPGALWSTILLEDTRVMDVRVPPLVEIVVAVDPAGKNRPTSDETGIVVVGRGIDGEAYVLADRSGHYSSGEWSERAWRLWAAFEADYVVVEEYGGDQSRDILRVAWAELVRAGTFAGNARMRLESVRAHDGKIARAKPVATMFENGRCHMVGTDMVDLENQLTTFDGTGDSPDRLDAMVWAVTSLFLQRPDEDRGKGQSRGQHLSGRR